MRENERERERERERDVFKNKESINRRKEIKILRIYCMHIYFMRKVHKT